MNMKMRHKGVNTLIDTLLSVSHWAYELMRLRKPVELGLGFLCNYDVILIIFSAERHQLLNLGLHRHKTVVVSRGLPQPSQGRRTIFIYDFMYLYVKYRALVRAGMTR